jgi:hypothetical protein
MQHADMFIFLSEIGKRKKRKRKKSPNFFSNKKYEEYMRKGLSFGV